MTLGFERMAMIAHAFRPEPNHMAMPQTIPWTRKDLDRLPDDGNRYELLDGELLVSPAPSPPHQQIVAWLSDVITPFVAAHRVGIVHQARSVMVRGDSTQVEPDLMVLPRIAFATWDDAPVPLLVIEVLSRSTPRRDLIQKRDFYLDRGVRDYWVVDRYSRSVTHITRDRTETVTTILTWTPAEGVAPALEIDIAAMFAEVSSA